MPEAVTIDEAATVADSQWFMLIGASVLVPDILGHAAWSYWVFRGQVGSNGYH